MTKRLTAKIGTYQKDGQTKGRYVNLGVILSNNNGEYMLMDPTIDLSGVLALQNIMARGDGQKERDRVMVSIFSDDGQRGGSQGNQGGYDSGSQGDQSGGYGSQGSAMDSDEIPFAPVWKV